MTVSTAFAPDRAARGLAIKQKYENTGAAGTKYRPCRIAVLGHGAAATTYSTTKKRVFSAREVGETYGYTSELYGAALMLLPPNGDGVGDIPVTIYPLAQPSPGVASAGSITPTGTISGSQTYVIKVGNIEASVTVTTGDTVATFCTAATAAINAVIGMPLIATDGTTKIGVAAGWKGLSGNSIVIEIDSPADADLTFVTVQPTGGSGTVDTAPALAQIGNIWETHLVNCHGDVSATITALHEFGEGRVLPEVHKAITCYTGINTSSVATVAAITDARKTDRTNVYCPNPDSNDLPWVIAARWVARIAKLANENPAHDYARLELTGLTQGADGSQWTSSQRDFAVKSGCSTIEVIDEVVNISDTVTCYHPTGEEPPAYRYVCDIQKLDTVIYNADLIFGGKDWAGAPLVPDIQAVKNPTAKKPKMAMSALAKMFGDLADDAVISDPEFAIANSSASIDGTNPKRLNVRIVCKLAGNTNVISVDVAFGFYYGE